MVARDERSGARPGGWDRVEKVEDLQQYKGKLKGAIIVLGKPQEMQSPGNPMLTPWGEETIPVASPKSDKPFDFAAYLQTADRANLIFSLKKKPRRCCSDQKNGMTC